MDSDRDYTPMRVRLPRYGAAGASAPEPGATGGATTSGALRARTDSIRRLRRMSNWTAAAMLAGTAVAAVGLAEHATTATTATTTASGGTVGTTGAHGASGPQVSGPVATSGGSGVTVSTTRRVVNGHVVITRVRHVAPQHDH
jgi:hypothetical protein